MQQGKSSFLNEALKRIFEQMYPPKEIILMLDGEITSKLHEIINQYNSKCTQAFRIISLKKNVGLGSALNEGLKCCSYDLVTRMVRDDICYTD